MQGHPANTDWITRLPGGRHRSYGAGEMISRPGMDANEVFLVVSGRARICLYSDNRELTLGTLDIGGVYVTHSRAWIEAVSRCETQSWPLRELEAVISREPQLALSAFREVGQVLQGAVSTIEDLAFRSVDSRLARFLLDESIRQGTNPVRVDESTEALASRLGTSRQTLSTLTNQLIRQKLIARPDRQHFELIDQNGLQRLADLSDA